MDVYSWWTLDTVRSSWSASHTESRNVCIMSVCSDLTELWLSERVWFWAQNATIWATLIASEPLLLQLLTVVTVVHKQPNYKNFLLFSEHQHAPLSFTPHSLKNLYSKPNQATQTSVVAWFQLFSFFSSPGCFRWKKRRRSSSSSSRSSRGPCRASAPHRRPQTAAQTRTPPQLFTRPLRSSSICRLLARGATSTWR